MNIGRNIVPSFLSVGMTERHSDGGVFDEWRIRYGEVQEILYPDDDRNRNKKFTEYNVFVQYRDSNGTGTGVVFNNCLITNDFGGLADQISYTLRAPSTPSVKDSGSYGLGLGSKVLLACLNGERANAYIIGGLRDPKDDGDDKNDGHHFKWVFNGIQATVNDDGEATLTYLGKTKIDGSTDDSVSDDAPGAEAQFLKNGNINLQTKDGKQQVLLDNENGKVVVQRDQMFQVGQGTDKMVLGTTYRQNEGQLNQTIQQQMSQLQGLLNAVATIFTSAVTPAPGAPIPALTSAGPLLVKAATCAGQIATAIGQFEAQAQKFLSNKSSLD